VQHPGDSRVLQVCVLAARAARAAGAGRLRCLWAAPAPMPPSRVRTSCTHAMPTQGDDGGPDAHDRARAAAAAARGQAGPVRGARGSWCGACDACHMHHTCSMCMCFWMGGWVGGWVGLWVFRRVWGCQVCGCKLCLTCDIRLVERAPTICLLLHPAQPLRACAGNRRSLRSRASRASACRCWCWASTRTWTRACRCACAREDAAHVCVRGSVTGRRR
jgi:hypothetical protein